MAVGFSLFTGLSWLKLAERTGAGLEWLLSATVGAWQSWQDWRVGREAEKSRDAAVEVTRRRFEEKEPLRIEPAEADIPKSSRREKERQQPLFPELPGGLLPPLTLLDESSHDAEPPSLETLEFTSR